MISERSYNTASVLIDGKVLVSGGLVELRSNSWNIGGLGGTSLSSAELYDPSTQTWTSTSNMKSARAYHTASVLKGGKVLVSGGLVELRSKSWNIVGLGGTSLSSAELYDPSTQTWTNTSNMNTERAYHTASVLIDGKVLVSGGLVELRSNSWNIGGLGGTSLNSVELYDPSTQTWTNTSNMNSARYHHTASVLTDGKVLFSGGLGDASLSNAELYEPSTKIWTNTSKMHSPRGGHTASVLIDGTVLVSGGFDRTSLNSAELYDPSTKNWTTTSNMQSARAYHTASVLNDGKVLVSGGLNGTSLKSAELYDPSTRTWTATSNMQSPRGGHTASVLIDGKVLVSGASGNTTELYHP
jgi:N-acetylneuraminic acid mutarotase